MGCTNEMLKSLDCSLSFLDEHAKGLMHNKGGQWSPLISYRTGLAGQEDEEEGIVK